MTRRPDGSSTTDSMHGSRACVALVLLVLLAGAGCGSDGDGGGPSPTPTPTPSPVPTETPRESPTAVPVIAPMTLETAERGGRGRATGVSPREWISIAFAAGQPRYGVTLPLDAGPAAGPLLVPGCPLGEASPDCEERAATVLRVGRSDWAWGLLAIELPSFAVDFPAVFGPGGEVELLVPCCASSDGAASDALPIPGARFVGMRFAADGAATLRRPILWRAPAPPFEDLPFGDFVDGPLARGGDAELRIAGEGLDPVLPVVWLPRGDAYELTTLPLLDGDVVGGAHGIDAGVVAGWSAAAGRTRPVLWRLDGDGAGRARVLPEPDGLANCRADAISLPRVAGSCSAGTGPALGVVWHGDGERWDVEAVLTTGAASQLTVTAMAGDLIVGTVSSFGSSTVNEPVAWRVPPR